jgi:hypothetical protein
MPKISGRDLIKLRLTEAHTQLLRIPKSGQGLRTVSLEWIGDYEIRMFEVSQDGSDNALRFWLELFDYGRQSAVDACICADIEEAVTTFEDFISQVNHSKEFPREMGTERKGE